MNSIKPNDIQVLSHYTFIDNGSNEQNHKLLGLKWIKDQNRWTQQLIEVDRQDVTCWTLFLSFFGQGKLANITVSLDKICSYLSQYQWQQIKLDAYQNRGTYKYKVFETVCQLANRQLKHGKLNLFKKVSNPLPSVFSHYWNPGMQGRFLLDLQRHQLATARGIELRFKNSNIGILPYQKLTKRDLMNIEVGYEYEQASRGDNHYYHYPNSPYYQTRSITNRRPKRREI